MQIGQAQVVRSEWFDRSPLIVTRTYSDKPASVTNPVSRWTYTVPANRKAFIGSLFLGINPADITASSALTVRAYVEITPSGGGTVIAHRIEVEPGLDFKPVFTSLNNAGLLSAGDEIEMFTEDNVLGSSEVIYTGTLSVTEFDA